MYFGCFGLWGELGFLNCDDVCMFVVKKQLELLEFDFDSVHVDRQYGEISLTFTVGSVFFWEQEECWPCVCVLVAVLLVV